MQYIRLNINYPKNLNDLNTVSNEILNKTIIFNSTFSRSINFMIICLKGAFILRLTKINTFFLFEVFTQINNYYIATWDNSMVSLNITEK